MFPGTERDILIPAVIADLPILTSIDYIPFRLPGFDEFIRNTFFANPLAIVISSIEKGLNAIFDFVNRYRGRACPVFQCFHAKLTMGAIILLVFYIPFKIIGLTDFTPGFETTRLVVSSAV